VPTGRSDNCRKAIEKSIAVWSATDASIPTAKGRVALYLILRSLGIGPGDEVLVPGFTCVVVPAAIKYLGATPVYYDIDLDTLQGNPDHAAAAVTSRTKAVLLQHNFGAIAPLGSLPETCDSRGIAIIEDCAHSLGAVASGRPAGTLGTASFCSLQWSKPTTTGLGGIARFNTAGVAAKARDIVATEFNEPTRWKALYLDMLANLYRKWFRPSWYWTAQDIYRFAGRYGLIQGSSDVDELQTAEMPQGYLQTLGAMRRRGLANALASLPDDLEHRRRIHGMYAREFGPHAPWSPPAESAGDIHVGLRFPLLVDNRAEFLSAARSARIEIGDWFNDPLHPGGGNHRLFDYEDGCCPLAEFAAARIINLPTHRNVGPESFAKVVAFTMRHAAWSERTA
jgi:perosamine synthetase